MIRTIITLLFVIIFLIASIPILIVEWIISKLNKRAADISSLRIVQWALKVVLFLSGVKLTVIGEENIPKDRAVLYIGNHRSIFDIVVAYSRCPGLTGFISKDNVKNIPVLSTWMNRLYCLFLVRDDMKQSLKVILAGIDRIKAGISMCVFPEGTRNKTDDPVLPFKAGTFKLAEKTGCPVIPMALTNTADVFENHFPALKATHVIIQYGEPVETADMDKDEKKHLNSLIQNKVVQMLEDNQNYL